MSEFQFVSHEAFPEDQYTSEIVYIQLQGLRIGYCHKKMQNGGSYWDVMGQSVTRAGQKESYKAIRFGDNFLAEDIKDFLKRRRWETSAHQPTATSMDELANDIPF